MRRTLFAMILAVVAGVASPAMAQNGRALAPSGPWNLEYDEDSCALRRMFGSGEDQAYLEFRRFGPQLGLQTTIASEGMRARNPSRFRYRLSDEVDWRDTTGINITMDSGFSGVLFNTSLIELPEEVRDQPQIVEYLASIDRKGIELGAAARVDTISLRGAYRRELTLHLEKLDAPIAALNECIDELMTHWDIDIEAHKSLTRPAVPTNFRETGRMLDYPPKMLRQSMPGIVNVRLAVDETGRITACHIQMPLSDPAFEESSCADIQRALEFDPALDKDGKPIASYWLTTVRFQMAQ